MSCCVVSRTHHNFFFFTVDSHWKCGVYDKHCGFLIELYAKIHSTLNAAINFTKNFLMLIYVANQWWLVITPDNTGSLLGKRVLIEARRWKTKFMSIVSPAAKEQKMIKGTFQTIKCYKIYVKLCNWTCSSQCFEGL